MAQIFVGGGVAAAIVLRCWLDSPPPLSVAVAPQAHMEQRKEEVDPRPRVAEIVERHLQWAQQQEAAGIAPQLAPLHEFFEEARLGTRAFAQDALGGWSKFYCAKDLVLRGQEHRRYLEERFAARVFATENLEMAVAFAVKAYLDHLDNIDSMLLVNLSADLESIPSSGFSGGIDRQAIEQSLNAAVGQAVRAVQVEMRNMVGQELISWVAGDVVVMASGKLAASAGIIGVGASTSTVSAGVTLAAALLVDMAITWAYDKYVDPAGQLSRQLVGTLAKLEELIVAGDYEHPGLCIRLHNYALQRAEARNAAIKAVVLPNPVSE